MVPEDRARKVPDYQVTNLGPIFGAIECKRHTEDAFGDDHPRSTSLRVPAQRVFQEIQVAVRINDFLRT